jgi:hypothetical protein
MNPRTLELAELAGFEIVEHPQEPGNFTVLNTWAETLEVFAQLIIHRERLACAHICETLPPLQYPAKQDFTAKICAQVLRSLNERPRPELGIPEYAYEETRRAQYSKAVNLILHNCLEIIRLQCADKFVAEHLELKLREHYAEYKL